MNSDRLLAHYERVAGAPDAIACLRRFIRDLAVRGKLVPQDPNDEPASELLKRIVAPKGPALKRGLSSREHEEVPFELPLGWSWSSIGKVCSKTGSGSTPRGGRSVYKNEGIPFIRSQNVYDDGLRLDEVAYIDDATHMRMAGTAVKPKDLLLNITGGSIGRCCLIRDDFGEGNVSQHVAIIRAVLPELATFLHQLILSPYFQNYIFEKQTGAGRGGLPKNRMDGIAVALPPLAEQCLIVAKVDELMVLCDRLEAARAEREAARDRLAMATLARLNTSDLSTFQDEVRFALNALTPLTKRPDQIKLLRQTILNLAVRGKLVPQDPNDEPASELLKRIATQRAVLLKSGYPNAIEARTQLKKQAEQALPAKLAPLPTGWEWATLQQCALIVIDCKNKTAPYAPSGIRLLRTTNVRDGKLNWVDQKFVSEQTYELWSQRLKPAPGDILITREAPMGEVAIIPEGEQVCLGQRMMLARLVRDTVDVRFMLYSLRDPNLMDRVQDKPIGMTVQHLRVGGVETLLVPLPPVDEQRRIVAKVDDVMGLCDRLEASLASGDETRRRLLDALLSEALAPGEPREMEAVA